MLDTGNSKLETGGTTSVLVEGGADLTAIVPKPESRSPKPRILPLLIEIGCEEIPARFLADTQKGLEERLRAALEDARLFPLHSHPLSPGERVVPHPAGPGEGPSDAGHRTPDSQTLQSYSTPRRLVAYLSVVLDKQPDKVEEVRGPAVKAAFDAQGKPTRAAESFAAKHGAEVQNLVKVSTAKGEYVAVRKSVSGRSALEVLPEIFPDVVTGLSFPKSMHWEKSNTRFIRPIRWLLALLGEGDHAQVVHFEVAGVRSGNETRGHRILDSSPISLNSFEAYSRQLRESLVEFDPEKRREQLRKEVQALLEASRLNLIEDRELEEWVVNSTEWPRVVLGSFDKRFLKLPREILITVMRDHQKYFALEDDAGNLQPQFIASLNLDSDPKGLIQAGHEGVLTARFSDAEFFWTADQRVLLRDRLPMLERVTYQAKLGSYADKIRRMEAIATEICGTLKEKGVMTADEILHAIRAVQLCKCDLTTQMVQEFTELQGIVGGLYAAAQAEPKGVAEAIYDHYLPQGAEDKCPRSVVGSMVSLVDKVDSVVAGFSVGLAPTGSNDPFALRRQGNGIIKLLIELELPISLWAVAKSAESAVEQAWSGVLRDVPGSAVQLALGGFFEDRLRHYLENVRGFRYDTVRAVLATGPAVTFAAGTVKEVVPRDVWERASAVEEMRGSDDFLAVCAAAKRIRNILTKSASDSDWQPGEPQEEWLQEEAERELYREFRRVKGFDIRHEAPERYTKFLRTIASLRPAVDLFFDKVLVMDEDPRLRQNRLRLLAGLNQKFSAFADLSQIESVTSSLVDAPTSKTVASDK